MTSARLQKDVEQYLKRNQKKQNDTAQENFSLEQEFEQKKSKITTEQERIMDYAKGKLTYLKVLIF